MTTSADVTPLTLVTSPPTPAARPTSAWMRTYASTTPTSWSHVGQSRALRSEPCPGQGSDSTMWVGSTPQVGPAYRVLWTDSLTDGRLLLLSSALQFPHVSPDSDSRRTSWI
jgi:hypothetical protein